jgi:hypothetical protein
VEAAPRAAALVDIEDKREIGAQPKKLFGAGCDQGDTGFGQSGFDGVGGAVEKGPAVELEECFGRAEAGGTAADKNKCVKPILDLGFWILD